MKLLLAALILSTAATCSAQMTSPKLSFALPAHPGTLSLDQGLFQITGRSAKPNGNELSLHADDHGLQFVGYLFVWPNHPNLTATSCRDQVLAAEGQKSLDAAMNRIALKSTTGTDIALVLMIPKDSSSSAIRAFVASGDLCGDLTFSSPHPTTQQLVPMESIKSLLLTLKFDPQAPPSFHGIFTYATVEFNHRQYPAAATTYQAALKLITTSDDPLKWRRITTDQLSLSLGMAGDLTQSQAVNQAAIALDPTYPLYYYNLACADAEQGNAAAARLHLQQAFDRKANTLPGETLPDPTSDESLLKLKSNQPFWTFAQTLRTKTGK